MVILVRNSRFDRSSCGLKFSFVWKAGKERVTLAELYAMLERVEGAEELLRVGFIRTLLVLPMPSRMPQRSGQHWKMDDRSHMYLDVLRRSLELRRRGGSVPQVIRDEIHARMQDALNILFDVTNTHTRLRRNVRDAGGLRQSVEGKKGLLRANIMGKRVDFCARTVLSGDPALGINEIGVPRSVAEKLTVNVRMNDLNINSARRARYVVKRDGSRYDLKVCPNILVEVGDVIERSLENGDLVAVNRQPTLHRGSIIGCYIRIFECSTFRLNYSTMITLNADTDGDEINMHVPQDLASRAELEELMLASTNIVSSQASAPLVGCTQDSLLGCNLLSRDAALCRADFQTLQYAVGVSCDAQPHVFGRSRALYPGNLILGCILDALGAEVAFYQNEKDTFCVRGNRVMYGFMDKSVVGVAENSLVHHVFLSLGHRAAARMLHMLQKAAAAYLDIVGFSVGVGDCVVEHPPIDFPRLEEHLLTRTWGGPEWTDADEGELCGALGELTKLKADSCPRNNLLAMINCGSKGSVMNFNQITRVVGQQQEIEGRIQRRMNNGTRTLPCYPFNCASAGSRGLVKHSFVKGLKPEEFFMHAMGGRIGIIDTSCKTAETGYLYRRLVKTLEVLAVKDFGGGRRPVVNTITGQVVMFQYGGDGLDSTYMKRKI